jgi:hypothetical protein
LCTTSWLTNVPQKIEVFAWEVVTYSLVVHLTEARDSLLYNQLVVSVVLKRGGGFHALINCAKSPALGCMLRLAWELPGEEFF